MFAYCGNNPVGFTDETGNRYCASTSVSSESAYDRFISCDHQQQVVQENLGQYCPPRVPSREEIALNANVLTFYRGVLVIRGDWSDRAGSFGIIYMPNEIRGEKSPEELLKHEYGHTRQLKMIGPFNYLTGIFIPSANEWSSKPYYHRQWEVTADILGGSSSTASQTDIEAGFAYLRWCSVSGLAAWLTIK